jgi:protein-tyrosine phosphatase
MIDLHSHILPGLDDGVRTVEEARALARRAAEDGITAIAATPHVRADYPTRPEQMEARVADLRLDFATERIPVEVLHGGELDFEMAAALDQDALQRFTLAKSGRYLVLEFPYRGWPLALEERLFALQVRGFVPVIAHPERNREVQHDPARLIEPVRIGALVQVTAASVDGRLGRDPRRAAERLLELDLVHVLASDAHAPDVRESGLAAAAAALGNDELARYLTVEAPGAIVAGEDVPRRTSRRRRRRFVIF